MYYPYLRAKSEEILALCELEKKTFKKFTPIIEPVSKTPTSIKKMVKLLRLKNKLVLIVNPIVKNSPSYQEMKAIINSDFLATFTEVNYAFIIDERTNESQVMDFLGYFKHQEKSFIHFGEYNDIKKINSFNVEKHFFIDRILSTNYVKSIKHTDKNIISDGFQKKSTNKDYPNKSFFSDLNVNYKINGFVGFGDFTIVGSEYSTTGGPAHAVAIHLTNHQGDAFYVNHFLSDNRTGPSNPAGKFLEALNHLIDYVDTNQLADNSGIKDFRELHFKQHFPGLGRNKRICIKNHIEQIISKI